MGDCNFIPFLADTARPVRITRTYENTLLRKVRVRAPNFVTICNP